MLKYVNRTLQVARIASDYVACLQAQRNIVVHDIHVLDHQSTTYLEDFEGFKS